MTESKYPNAIAWAKAGHGDGIAGHCLKNVADAFDAPHGVPDAYASWVKAGGAKGPNTHTSTTENPPPNVPIYWSGGHHGDGHVAISDGAGWCWSTEQPTAGKFRRCRVSDIHREWGLTYLGWSETINGKRIHDHVKYDAKRGTWV
jgi:hypothetical protein